MLHKNRSIFFIIVSFILRFKIQNESMISDKPEMIRTNENNNPKLILELIQVFQPVAYILFQLRKLIEPIPGKTLPC